MVAIQVECRTVHPSQTNITMAEYRKWIENFNLRKLRESIRNEFSAH